MVAVLCAAGVQSQKAKIGLERQEFQGFFRETAESAQPFPEANEHQHVLMSFPERFTLIGLFLRFSLISELSCILPSPGLHKAVLLARRFFIIPK